MKPNLKTIKEHLNGIPTKRLPLGKIAWLQEWEETKELIENLEATIREYLQAEQENYNTALAMEDSFNRDELLSRSWGRVQLLKGILGENEA